MKRFISAVVLAAVPVLCMACIKVDLGKKQPGYYLNGKTLLPTTDIQFTDKWEFGVPQNYPTISANTPFFIQEHNTFDLEQEWMKAGGGWVETPDGGLAGHAQARTASGVRFSMNNPIQVIGFFETTEVATQQYQMSIENYDPRRWDWDKPRARKDGTLHFAGLPAGVYVLGRNFLVVVVVK